MGSSDPDKINQASGGCASVSGINRSFASAFLLTKDKELMEKLFISNAVSFTRNSVVSNFIKPLFCCEPSLFPGISFTALVNSFFTLTRFVFSLFGRQRRYKVFALTFLLHTGNVRH